MSFPSTPRAALRHALFALPVLIFAPAALAAADGRAQQDRLDEVVVTATRTPVDIARVGNSISVLDELAIQESQAVIASDLLATLPGVGVVRTGGPGSTTAIRLRGAPQTHTMVLVDGVQMNDPSQIGGEFDFANLLLGDTSRIEVLRGPQSTLYGSQAIGGVVNIITARPGEGFGGHAMAEYGSMDTRLLQGALGYGSDRTDARLGVTWYDTDGISAYAGGAEDDAFRNTTVSGRLGYQFTDAVGVDLRAWFTDGKASYDGYPPPTYAFGDAGDFGRTRSFNGYAGLNFALADGRLRNRLAVTTSTTDRDGYSGDIGEAEWGWSYKGERLRYEYQGTWTVSERLTAVFGAEREETQMRSDPYEPARADASMNSYYLQGQFEVVDGLVLTAGDRYDDHSTFGSEHSPQVAVAWSLDTGTILRASWGEGFKAPTLYQLHGDYRNPDLQPETARGWDAGVEQRFLDNRAAVSATWYQRNTRNLIGFGYCSDDPTYPACSVEGNVGYGYYYNVGRVRAQGLELAGTFTVTEHFDLSANYTRTEAEDRTGGSTTYGVQIARVPKDLANATATFRWTTDISTGLTVRYVGSSRTSDSLASRQLDSYTLVDLRAAWKLRDALQLAARVENLFDKDYEQAADYGTPGRAGYISLRYDF